MLSRRKLFLTAGALALPVALGANTCNMTTAQWQSDIDTVVNGLKNLVPLITAAGVKIGAGTMGQINKLLADIQANEAGIGGALTPNVGTIQQIQQDVGLVAALVAPFFPQATAVGALVEAAVSLIGFVVAQVNPTAAAAKALPQFDPATARAILEGKGVAQ